MVRTVDTTLRCADLDRLVRFAGRRTRQIVRVDNENFGFSERKKLMADNLPGMEQYVPPVKECGCPELPSMKRGAQAARDYNIRKDRERGERMLSERNKNNG